MRPLHLAVLALAVGSAAGCKGSRENGQGPAPDAGSVEVHPAAAAVEVGNTRGFTALVRDAGGTEIPGASVTWESSDPATATIDAEGVATGLASGETVITARNGAIASPGVTLGVMVLDGTVATSEQLIDEAERSGFLDPETALLYRVYSAFGDDRLPPEYRGDDSLVVDSAAMAEVADRYDRLSPATQAALAPFLVPPYYEGSWHDLRHRSLGASFPAGLPRPQVPPNAPLLSSWRAVDTANGKARVWWFEKAPGDEAVAKRVAAWIDSGVWTKLATAMGREPLSDGGYPFNGGDGRLDIAIVDARSAVHPYFPGCSARPVYMNFRASASRSILAHELMHAVQYSYEVSGGVTRCADYMWWREATAQWYMDHDDPAANEEQLAAPDFLRVPTLPLETANKRHEYGAYLLPSLLAGPSRSPAFVRASWIAAGTLDVLGAIDASLPGGFAQRWPEFALQAWNQAPWSKFRDWDRLGDRPELSTDTEVFALPDGAFPVSERRAEHLSISYHLFRFTDPDVRSVVFYNGLSHDLREHLDVASNSTVLFADYLPPDPRGALRVLALKKVGGQWSDPEDWTRRDKVRLCRDEAAERVNEVVLVFTSSEHQDRSYVVESLGLPLTARATRTGCWRWKGTLTRTVQSQPGVTESLAVDVTWGRGDAPIVGGVGVEYRPVQSSVRWNIAGTSLVNRCAYTGSAQAVLDASWLWVFDDITSGDMYRGYEMHLDFLPRIVDYQETCPDPNGPGTITTVGTASLGPLEYPSSFVAAPPYPTVSGDGLTVAHRWSSPDGTETVQWSFTAERQP